MIYDILTIAVFILLGVMILFMIDIVSTSLTFATSRKIVVTFDEEDGVYICMIRSMIFGRWRRLQKTVNDTFHGRPAWLHNAPWGYSKEIVDAKLEEWIERVNKNLNK